MRAARRLRAVASPPSARGGGGGGSESSGTPAAAAGAGGGRAEGVRVRLIEHVAFKAGDARDPGVTVWEFLVLDEGRPRLVSSRQVRQAAAGPAAAAAPARRELRARGWRGGRRGG